MRAGSVRGPIAPDEAVNESGNAWMRRSGDARALAAHVEEVNLRAVHVGDELRERVERGLVRAEVVPVEPARGEALHEAHVRAHAPARALGGVGQARALEAGAEVVEGLLAHVDAEGRRLHGEQSALRARFPLEGMRQSPSAAANQRISSRRSSPGVRPMMAFSAREVRLIGVADLRRDGRGRHASVKQVHGAAGA